MVIPHLYNGKNRTYFFTNFDLTYLNTGVNSAYNETVPTAKMTDYDFSELLSYGGNAGKVVSGPTRWGGTSTQGKSSTPPAHDSSRKVKSIRYQAWRLRHRGTCAMG